MKATETRYSRYENTDRQHLFEFDIINETTGNIISQYTIVVDVMDKTGPAVVYWFRDDEEPNDEENHHTEIQAIERANQLINELKTID